MHYRWHYAEGAEFASRHLAEELLGSVPAPIWIKKLVLQRRQRSGYTTGDGITPINIESVEANFKTLLKNLENIFTNRPFILGDRPSLADIGFSGPFFRHFALDPVPLEIIRQQAPKVLSWVSRLWNTRIEDCSGSWVEGIPDDLEPLLREIGNTYLPYLCANIDAINSNRKRLDVNVGGMLFKGARCSQYRVWCVSELRSHYQSLSDQSKSKTRKILEKYGCWDPLWHHEKLPLLDNQEIGLPFKADTKMVGIN